MVLSETRGLWLFRVVREGLGSAVIVGLETYPLLPDMQGNRCNLARQRQTRHLRPDALGQQRRVELSERTGLVGSDDRRTFEDMFQIVIVVGVEPANGDLLRGPS